MLFALQATVTTTTAEPLDIEAADQLVLANNVLMEKDLAVGEDALIDAENAAEDQAIEGRGRPWWSFGV